MITNHDRAVDFFNKQNKTNKDKNSIFEAFLT